MRVLRSRKILPTQTTPKPQKTGHNDKFDIEPSTPAKTNEPFSSALQPSPDPDPDPVSDQGSISAGSGPDSVSVSGLKRRRSLRLASKMSEPVESSAQSLIEGGCRRRKSGSGENPALSTAEKAIKENEEGIDGGVLGMSMAVSNEVGFDLFGKRIRVAVNGEGLGDSGLCSNLGNFEQKSDDARGKRKLGIDINFPASEFAEDEEGEKRFLNLRSGKKVAKRGLDGVESEVEDLGNFGKDLSERDENRKGKLGEYCVTSNGVELDFEQISLRLDVNQVEHGAESIFDMEAGIESKKGKRTMGFESEDGITIGTEGDPIDDENDINKGRKKFSREEKGKGKLVEDDSLIFSNTNIDRNVGLVLESEVKNSADNVVSSAISSVDNVVSSAISSADNVVSNAISSADNVELNAAQVRNSNRKENGRYHYMQEQFRRIARRNASRYAFFDDEEEEYDELPAEVDSEPEMEDWPGPFSTAMKIIKDRERRILWVDSSVLPKIKPPEVEWIPKTNEDRERSKHFVPSLLELSLTSLANNADEIVSLHCVPDCLRHRLSQLLCDSRRMNGHFFKLLVQGSPTEIRLKDCSWLTEEEFTKSLQNFDPSNLIVLQLDQCGRCLPDYVLLATLSRSVNNMPALTTVSLRGACRLSDVGLKSLVSSAPALKSLNLSQCSLLTSSSIDMLANSLGSVLRELYLDDCQSIDTRIMLPALMKFEQLEVLSLAGIENVCDEFITEFISIRGHNMKELVLTDCIKLTDSSLKIIAETCPGLLAIDIRNLSKLTDSALRYLANGCRTIQKLKLCRNPFSDQSIAAFLETSGECLEELSLNNVRKVGGHTALSIARCSRKLHSLDLSWCRNLTDKLLGFIVDSCLSLRVLKLFGCTQITNVFLDGHSNPQLQIIGLKMCPVLEHVQMPNPYEAPLRYSSVPS